MRLARIYLAVSILRIANVVSIWMVPEMAEPCPRQQPTGVNARACSAKRRLFTKFLKVD